VRTPDNHTSVVPVAPDQVSHVFNIHCRVVKLSVLILQMHRMSTQPKEMHGYDKLLHTATMVLSNAFNSRTITTTPNRS
jgi:hypothetical protein